MSSHDFKQIYARPTRVQDLEHYIVNPIFLLPNNPLTEVVYIARDGKWEAWYREDEVMQLFAIFAAELQSDTWSIDKHLQEFARDTTHLKSATLELGKAAALFDTQQLGVAYENVFEAWKQYIRYLWIPWAITYILEDVFVDRLKHVSQEWQNIYNALAVSTKPIQMQQLIEHLLEWKIAGAHDDGTLDTLVNKYAHLGVYSVNEVGWTKHDLLEQIADIADPDTALQEMRQARSHASKQVQWAYQQLEHDPSLVELAKTIHEYVYLRTERIDVFKWTRLHDAVFYRAFENHFKLDFGWAGHLTRDEIIAALHRGHLPDRHVMNERAQERYTVYLQPGKTRVITDAKEIKDFIRATIPHYFATDKKDSIQGRAAYAGVVRGKARLVLRLDQVPEMQPGEILISNMTHPDYMPAIHKAAGIVTDEGGIVCHAAIISRELQIPCVIGTGEATKVFHTGDMVEVDAQKGIVKKI